jgi:hypothetical protein
MPPKHIPTDGQGRAIENPIIRSKAKPKPYREPDWLRKYRLDRERYFWQKFPEQREYIQEWVKEMKRGWAAQDKRK